MSVLLALGQAPGPADMNVVLTWVWCCPYKPSMHTAAARHLVRLPQEHSLLGVPE